MHFTSLFTLLPLLSLLPSSLSAPAPAPLDALATHDLHSRQSACSAYTLLNTRGTGEPQAESSGFRTMNAAVLRALPGGQVVNTVYAASFSQNSARGTAFILSTMTSTLARDRNHCFILEGYSQGAAATVNALKEIPASDARFAATRGVFLIGNPLHVAGLACNVDTDGGSSTDNVNGISVGRFGGSGRGVPAEWVSKTLDVCNFGDGVCDTTNGRGINAAHLAYPRDRGTQQLGEDFIRQRLAGGQ